MKKTYLLTTIAMLCASVAHANGPWLRFFQDAKFPTQAMLEHYSWSGPQLGTTTWLSAAQPQSIGATLTISSFTSQPDVARNIVLTPGGSSGAVGAGNAVITGTNIFGKTITESLALTSGQTSAATGSKAFKSVSSVALPAALYGGGQWNVGVGSKLGISRCMDDAGKYAFSEFGGVYDASRGTMSTNATAVESNTFQPASTLSASSSVDLFYVENYRCYGN